MTTKWSDPNVMDHIEIIKNDINVNISDIVIDNESPNTNHITMNGCIDFLFGKDSWNVIGSVPKTKRRYYFQKYAEKLQYALESWCYLQDIKDIGHINFEWLANIINSFAENGINRPKYRCKLSVKGAIYLRWRDPNHAIAPDQHWIDLCELTCFDFDMADNTKITIGLSFQNGIKNRYQSCVITDGGLWDRTKWELDSMTDYNGNDYPLLLSTDRHSELWTVGDLVHILYENLFKESVNDVINESLQNEHSWTEKPTNFNLGLDYLESVFYKWLCHLFDQKDEVGVVYPW
eukprot:339729_1